MENNSNPTVLEVINQLIEKFSTQVRVKNGKEVIGSSNAKDYKMLKNSLEKFILETYRKSLSTFSFRDITSIFLLAYVTYLEKRGLEARTKGAVPNRLKKLQAVFNHAREMGIKDMDSAVFRSVEYKMKIEESVPLVIPSDIIRQIETIDRSKFTKTEQFHIDLFLFSYYSGGMSCSDMAYLTMDNINKGMFIYEKMRVHKMVEVPLISESRVIMLTYRNKCHGQYVLPILLSKHKSEKQQRERIERLSLQVNKTLVKVRKEIRFKKKISLSSSLPAYIAMMVKTKVDPYHISQNTGCTIDYISKHFL